MSHFQVRNFDKFQHYKNRRPPWIKLHAQLLDSYDFSHLSDVNKAHAMLIWLLASQMENRVPMDAVWVARKIGATEPVDLQALIEAGMLEPCKQPASKKRAPSKQLDALETETEKEAEKIGDAPASRPQDLLWEAVCLVCGIDWRKGLGKAARSELNTALKDLRAMQATPEEVAPRAKRYCDLYGRDKLTPLALAKHWPKLGSAPKPVRVADPREAAAMAASEILGEAEALRRLAPAKGLTIAPKADDESPTDYLARCKAAFGGAA